MSFGWHLPLLACPLLEHVLRRSPAEFFSPPPPPPCRSAVGVSKDPLLPPPNWSKGRRSSSSYTCDRLWKRCLLKRSSSRSWDWKVNIYITHENWSHWKFRSSRVSPSQTVTSYLLDMILAVFVAIHRKVFVFHVAIPSMVSWVVSMCRFFVQLEHIWMWSLMIMLLQIFVYFGSWWHSGIEAARTNLTCPRTWDLFHDWHATCFA